jgi:purine-cytosine permease-like protein
VIKRLEDFVFGHRAPILVALALFTVVMGWSATRLHMEAGILWSGSCPISGRFLAFGVCIPHARPCA